MENFIVIRALTTGESLYAERQIALKGEMECVYLIIGQSFAAYFVTSSPCTGRRLRNCNVQLSYHSIAIQGTALDQHLRRLNE